MCSLVLFWEHVLHIVFFYDPSYYLGNPTEILKIWNGGLASHGGVIGILIAIFLYSHDKPEEPYLWLLDRIALTGGLIGFFVRLANLFNSEIIGTPTTLPWAFVFANIDDIPRHPVQLYESLAYGLIFIFILTIYNKQKYIVRQGFIAGLFIVLFFTVRILLEFLKMPQASYSSDFPLSVGQLLSIPFCLMGIILLIYSCSKYANKNNYST